MCPPSRAGSAAESAACRLLRCAACAAWKRIPSPTPGPNVMDVCFLCPSCERPARVRLGAATDWQCQGCEHRQHIEAAPPELPCCVLCGDHELYKKKDFPHWLGMTILVVACVSSVYTYFWYDKWLTWAILIGSAVIDGGLYLMVVDAVVCYRCTGHS